MNKKIAYLTFDDGPTPSRLEKMALLKEKKIPAVFFSEGRFLEKRPELGVRTIEEGFVLGNHAFSHPHFSDLSLAACCSEIERTDHLIADMYQAAGVPWTHKYFRFPYGDTGDGRCGYLFHFWKKRDSKRYKYLQDFLKELGYRQPEFYKLNYPFPERERLKDAADWSWTFDVMEWAMELPSNRLEGTWSLKKVHKRIASTCPKDIRGPLFFQKRWLGHPTASELILMHDHDATAEYFPQIMDSLEKAGLVFSDFK